LSSGSPGTLASLPVAGSTCRRRAVQPGSSPSPALKLGGCCSAAGRVASPHPPRLQLCKHGSHRDGRWACAHLPAPLHPAEVDAPGVARPGRVVPACGAPALVSCACLQICPVTKQGPRCRRPPSQKVGAPPTPPRLWDASSSRGKRTTTLHPLLVAAGSFSCGRTAPHIMAYRESNNKKDALCYALTSTPLPEPPPSPPTHTQPAPPCNEQPALSSQRAREDLSSHSQRRHPPRSHHRLAPICPPAPCPLPGHSPPARPTLPSMYTDDTSF
jgi:hypothetical protein